MSRSSSTNQGLAELELGAYEESSLAVFCRKQLLKCRNESIKTTFPSVVSEQP